MIKKLPITDVQLAQYNKLAQKRTRLNELTQEINTLEDQFLRLVMDFHGVTDFPADVTVADREILLGYPDKKE